MIIDTQIPDPSVRKITKQEFIDWVMKQDPDKVFNFGESRSASCRYGCPMIQFGQSVLGLDDFNVTMSFWNDQPEHPVAQLEIWIDKIIPTHLRGWNDHKYDELQNWLRHEA